MSSPESMPRGRDFTSTHAPYVNLGETRRKIALPSKPINAEGLIAKWEHYVTTNSFGRILSATKSAHPNKPPQLLSTEVIYPFGESFLEQCLLSLQKDRPIAFAIGYDYLAGMLTVLGELIPVLNYRHITPEEIRQSVESNIQPVPTSNPAVSEVIEELITVYTLIQEDPTGISLTRHYVDFVKNECRKPQDQRYGLLSTANPDFAILGAQVAGILYKASYVRLVNSK